MVLLRWADALASGRKDVRSCLAMAHSITSEFLALQTALAGRYSLELELGRGGMGIVYLAHEVSLDRPVAGFTP